MSWTTFPAIWSGAYCEKNVFTFKTWALCWVSVHRLWLTKVWEDVKFAWDTENRLQRKFFFSTSNLVQSMIILASFPDSLHTANNGKLGRAWKWGYDCLCHTHLIMDPPIWIKLSNQRETLPRELLKILDPSFHTWEPWVYEDYGRWL